MKDDEEWDAQSNSPERHELAIQHTVQPVLQIALILTLRIWNIEYENYRLVKHLRRKDYQV